MRAAPHVPPRRLPLVLATLAATLCAAAALAVGPPPAQACNAIQHCYGIAEWTVASPSGFHGAHLNLRTNCMSLNDFTNAFIDNEMWVIKGDYWTEAGLTEGTPNGPLDEFFWADQRPGGGYHEHYGTLPFQFNTYYGTDIAWAGGGTWNVSVGSLSGTSSGQFAAPAYTLETGTEDISSSSPHSYGSSTAMGYYDLNGGLRSGWTSGISGHATLYANAPVYVSWANTYDWIRDGIGAAC